MTTPTIKPLLLDTYLAMINNAVGSEMFKNGYASFDGVKKDVVNDGELSCAIFVSSILKIFSLIDDVHATVTSTVKKMEEAGWQKTEELIPGSVLVWEGIDFGGGDLHTHIGFYIGNDQAISNDFRTKKIIKHHFKYVGDELGERAITAIYYHPTFMKND
ncbi:MAG: hypothetical protein KBC48_01460 [Candidatus Pacebacteria bacterium]|nr:hypothetical protein [Candidatus Paceibacterota bacterium]